MTDLYKVLGVERDATRDKVRRAYKKLAMENHPDRGGDKKQFQLIKLADDVLSDEARRRQYDATGEFENKPVDNAFAELSAYLMSVIDGLMASALDQGIDPLSGDFVFQMRAAIAGDKTATGKAVQKLKRGARDYKRLAKRFRTNNKENKLTEMVEGRVRSLEDRIRNAERKLELSKRAQEFLADYTFDPVFFTSTIF